MAPLRRTVFSPKAVPSGNKPEDVAHYARSEMERLAKALTSQSVVQFEPLHVEPDKLRQALVAYADGTDWNPSSGEGIYVYAGGSWRYLYYKGGTDVSLADGGTGASLSDPNKDRLLLWDDSAGTVKFPAIADFQTETAPAAGDYLVMQRAEDEIVLTDWSKVTDLVNASTATLESGSLSGANTDMFEDTSGLWAKYRTLLLEVEGASHNSGANQSFNVTISTDGSTFITSNYFGFRINDTPTGTLTSTVLGVTWGTFAAAGSANMYFDITGHQGGSRLQANWNTINAGATSGNQGRTVYQGADTALKGLRISTSGGSFDAGTYRLVGIK